MNDNINIYYESYPFLFECLEKAHDVHLGVADKWLLKTLLNSEEIRSFYGLRKSARLHLMEFGYESKALKEFDAKQRRFEKGIADEFYARNRTVSV